MKNRTLLLVLIVLLCWDVPLASSKDQPTRSAKDISAIRHRAMGGQGLGNWYSLDREKELGKQLADGVEQSAKLLDDPAITEYVDRVAGTIYKNSDAQIPITVRLLDSEKVEALSLPGGYQYLTRGLLLQLENESELASVLARGIAHTALRSTTRMMTRERYAEIGTIPIILSGSTTQSSSATGFGLPVTFLKFRRGSEAAADYFGVQYVYKAGYSTESFSRMIQKIWPDVPVAGKAFNSFPPTSERLKALEKESSEILPKLDGAIVSTPEFEAFRKRLQNWKPSEPVQPQTKLLPSK